LRAAGRRGNRSNNHRINSLTGRLWAKMEERAGCKKLYRKQREEELNTTPDEKEERCSIRGKKGRTVMMDLHCRK